MSADPPRRPHPAAPQPDTPRRVTTAPRVGFSTRLPLDLVRRVQIAAPQLQLRQAEIAELAIDDWLRTRDF